MTIISKTFKPVINYSMGNSLESAENNSVRWYVMRDLKRSNSKMPAYKVLQEHNYEVFTPMQWKIKVISGVKVREYVPFMSDLTFVHASKQMLDPILSILPTLQYRYLRGGKYKEGMFVKDLEMNLFINAVKSFSNKIEYFMPAEIDIKNIGKKVKIVGGPLDGYEGNLLKIIGVRKKRLLIEIPNLLTAAVEVDPEFIQIMK